MSTLSATVQRVARRQGVWLLVPLAVVILLGVPQLPLNDYYLRLLNLAAIAIILVASLNLIYGFAGQVSLGHVGFQALGAYGTSLLMTRQDLSFWLAWPAGIAITAAIAWAIGRPVLRLRHFYFAVATFAFAIVVHTVANRWIGLTGGPVGVFDITRPTIPWVDLRTEGGFFFLAGGSMVATLAGLRKLVQSPFGRTLRAIREGEEPVDALGIHTARAKSLAFVISGALAGAAGGLAAILTQYVGPGSFTESHSIQLLAVLVIGGLGRQLGAVLGGILLVFLTEVARLAGDYQHLVYAGALLAAIMYLPEGLAGLAARVGRLVRRTPTATVHGPNSAASVSPTRPRRDTEVAQPDDRQDDHSLLSVKGLTCRYGQFIALNHFDMEVAQGQLVSLIGPNGAGKSTFINAISGVVPASSGTVTLDGTHIERLASHRIGSAGLVRTFQTTRLFTRMTLEDNILVGAHAAAKDDDRIPARSPAELLSLVGLGGPSAQMAGSLPFGKRRLLELARALATRPRLLLLDEPAAGLNDAETARLGELLLQLKAEGLTIVLVEHDLRLVMNVSDHVVVVAFGEKIAEGAPHEIQQDQRVITAYLGTKSPVEPMQPTTSIT